ncbi:MAG: hypothetical protein KJ737_09395 [Proteobacteria bacterium]|nr:hypothetical protein [Pseudomonadota bacterium]
MSNVCILFGEIHINSEPDAISLKQILERRIYLDTYDYIPEKKILIIDAGFDTLKHINWLEKFVYKKISEYMPENSFGRLYFKEGQFFSCIYFGYQKYHIADYGEPDFPEWWNGKGIRG